MNDKRYIKLAKVLLPTLIFSSFCVNLFASENSPFVFRSTKHHKVKLLNHGSSSFYKRIKLIKEAKKSIILEYFIFNHDLAGKLIVNELVKKAKEGVQVQILVDNFMVGEELSGHHSAELIRQGIQIKYYNTLPFINAVKTNYRNHRKLFMIDDYHYIVGGRNIGNDYFDLSERYNFVDRDVLFSGESGKLVRQSFDIYFDSKISEKKYRPVMPTINQLEYLRSGNSQRSRLLQQLRAKRRMWRESRAKAKMFLSLNEKETSVFKSLMEIGKSTYLAEYEGSCNDLEFVSDRPLTGPSNDHKRITRNYIYKYLKDAKKHINIDSPYFILHQELIDIIDERLQNDVKVTLLTNGIYSSDALPVAAVFNHYLKEWIQKGLVPHVYSGKSLMDDQFYISDKVANSRWGTHSKSISIDGSQTVIGSYNFDPRSAVYSMELMVSCYQNPELAKAHDADIELRKENSLSFKSLEDVKNHEFHNVSMFKQMGYYLVKPLSLLFQWFL